MATNNDLRVLISGELNEEMNTKSINKQLKRIQRNLNHVKVNVVIDDKITKTLNDFSKQFKRIQDSALNTGKVIEEAINPDGSKVKRTYFDGLKGEFKELVQQAKENIKGNEDQSASLEELTNDYNKLTKQTEKYNVAQKKLGETLKYQDKDGVNSRTINVNGDGSIKSYTDTYDAGKEIKQKQLAIKQEQDLIEQMASFREQSLERRRKEEKQLYENQAKAINRNAQLEREEIAKTQKTREDYANWWEKKLKEQDIKDANKGDVIANSSQLKDLTNATEQQIVESLKLNGVLKDQKVLGASLNRVTGQWSVTIKDSANQQRVLKGQVDKTTGSLRKQSDALQDISSRNLGVLEQLKIGLTRFPVWMAAATAFYLPLRVGEQLLTTLIQIDDQLIAIEKVASNSNMDEVMNSARESAYELGRTLDGALASYEQIAKMGFNQEETQTLSRNSMLLSTVGDMQDADAANYLVAAMKQYRIEVKDTIDVVNSWNQLSNNAGTTSEDLAQAMAKSGSAARNAGVSFHEFNAMTATLTESLKISGKEAGNAMKAVFNRVLRPQVRSDLEDLGVKTETLNGEMVSATKIIEQLSEKWSTYTAQQRNAISQSLGGVWHINKVNTLIQQQSDIVENTAHSMDSYKSAEKELETFQQGLTYQINQMKLSFQELAVVLGENGVRATFVAIIELITKMTRWFTNVTEATEAWNIKLPLLTGAILGVYKGVQSLIGGLTALATAGRVTMSAFGWIGLAATALSFLVPTLIGSANAAEINAEAYAKQSEEYSNQANELERLIDKYDELKPQAETNKEKQKELEQVLQEIHAIAPQVITDTNEYGKALDINRQKAEEFINSLRDLSKEQLQNAKNANDIKIANAEDEVNELSQNLSKAEQELKDAYNFFNSYKDKYDVSTISEADRALNNRIDKLKEQWHEGTVSMQEYNSEMTRQYEEFNKFKDVTDDTTGSVGSHSEALTKLQEKQAELESLKERGVALEKELKGETDKTTSSIDKQTQSQQENANVTEDQAQSTEELEKQLDELNKRYDETTDSISRINGYLQEYEENNKLSADSIVEIIDQYPELIKYINNESELIKQLKMVRDDDIKAMKEQVNEKLMLNEDFYNNNLKALEDFLSETFTQYDKDLTQFKNLAQAKADVEEELINEILKKRQALYYDETQQAFSGDDWFVHDDTLRGQVNDANEQLDELRSGFEDFTIPEIDLDFDSIGISSPSGGGSTKTPDKPPEPDYRDPIDAQIREINNQNLALEDQYDILQDRIDATDDYNKQLELTNELILLQDRRVRSLESSNNQLSNKMSQVGSSSGYDTSNWLDENGEFTTDYISQYNSLSKSAQENMSQTATRLQKLKQAYIQNEESIRSLTNNSHDLVDSLDDIKESIKDQEWETLQQSLSKYDDEVDDLNHTLSISQSVSERLEESTFDHTKEILRQIDLYERLQDAVHRKAEAIREELLYEQLSVERKKELSEEIENLQQQWQSYESAISSIQDNFKNNQRDLADDIIETMKNAYEKQRDYEIKAIENEMSELEESHERKMEMYDEEVESLEEIISKKLKQIDIEENNRSFNDEMSELQSNAQEIQSELNTARLDDSVVGRLRQQELEEELANAKEQIEEKQHERTVELRKRNLNDQLDTYREDVESKKDAETDKYNSMRQRLEEERDEIQYHYNEILNNERKWTSMRNSIISGHIDSVSDQLYDFLFDFKTKNKEASREIGESWQDVENMVEEIVEAQEKLVKLKNNGVQERGRGDDTSDSSDSGSSSNNANEQEIINQMKSNSQMWADAEGSPEAQQIYYQENQRLGASIGAEYRSNGTWWKDGDRLYHEGGIVGGRSTKLGEIVDKLFNAKNGERITKSLIGEVQIPPKNFGTGIKRMQEAIAYKSPTPQSNTVHIDNLLNVDHIDNNTDIRSLTQKITKELMRQFKPYGV